MNGGGPCDLAWDGENLWYNHAHDQVFYKTDPEDGAILGSIPYIGKGSGADQGICFDDEGYAWTTTNTNDRIYKRDPGTGAVLENFALPSPSVIEGITWDDNTAGGPYIWATDDTNTDEKILQLDTEGNVINSWEVALPGGELREKLTNQLQFYTYLGVLMGVIGSGGIVYAFFLFRLGKEKDA